MSALRFSPAGAPGVPIPDVLHALAPLDLPNEREQRFLADNHCVSLKRLSPRDQELIKLLYAQLQDLEVRLTNPKTSDAQKMENVQGWVKEHRLDNVVELAQELGRASLTDNADLPIAKAMHDIRGGALTSLLGYLQLVPADGNDEAQLTNLFRLCRDQLKIMRSALTELDEPRRERDRLPRAHDVKLVLGKWHAVVVGPQLNYRPRGIEMFVDCRHAGAITECCLESAAIDRIFHNLTSNACRHAATDRIDLVVFHVPPPDGQNLRFVLSNEISAEQVESLRALMRRTPQGDLRALFEAGVSTTGSGYGMAVVADLVAGAFGLSSPQIAVERGYTGAYLDGSIFRVWFHWPEANNDLPAKLDDHHHPS